MKKPLAAQGLCVRARAAALLGYLLGAGCGDAAPRPDPPVGVTPEPASAPTQPDTTLPSTTGLLSSSPEPSSSAASTDEEGLPPPATTLPTLRFLKEYGCEACAGPELLDLVRGVAAGSGRSFAVLTGSPPYVRVWNVDSDGAAQFGAEGDGPAELRRPIGVGLFHDSVMVFDYRGGTSRIQVYTATGTHVRYASPSGPLSFGTFLGYSASPSGNWTLWAARPFQSPSRRIIRINTESASANSIEIPPQLVRGSADPLASAGVSVAVSDEGVVALGEGDEYRLALISSDGTSITHGGRDIPRHIRSQEELDSMRIQIARTFAAGNIRRPPPAFDENRFREVPHFARDGLAFDGHNRLWVKTSHGRDTTIFDIFSSSLEYVGSVAVEGVVGPYHVGSTFMVASSVSPLGVPTVKVWSLVGP